MNRWVNQKCKPDCFQVGDQVLIGVIISMEYRGHTQKTNYEGIMKHIYPVWNMYAEYPTNFNFHIGHDTCTLPFMQMFRNSFMHFLQMQAATSQLWRLDKPPSSQAVKLKRFLPVAYSTRFQENNLSKITLSSGKACLLQYPVDSQHPPSLVHNYKQRPSSVDNNKPGSSQPKSQCGCLRIKWGRISQLLYIEPLCFSFSLVLSFFRKDFNVPFFDRWDNFGGCIVGGFRDH